ncbi:MAG: PIG-L family deacetylase [Gemmatimonadaceae bacterium]
MLKRAFILGFSLIVASAPRLVSQERGAAAFGELVEGLGTTTRVMMIGAHPDDEDTQLIAYLAKSRHIETAYLSLTRGDGGQNLIGNELGVGLGMIRTEELLAARRLDGGRQYFTRAFDFGFSKSKDETFDHWPKDSILKDVVEIVRAFRPQVIIAVFTGTPADGHGHHQYSGVIAREVFDAAADSVRFPASQVSGLQPWAPSKFYRLRRGGFGGPNAGGPPQGASLVFNVGEFDPLLGESYSEIATASRSQHRSQGQGALPQRGPRYSGVRLEASRVSDPAAPERTLFDGIDTTWARFRSLKLVDSARAAADSIPEAEAAVRRSMDLTDPSKSVASLATFNRLVLRAATGVRCSTLTAGPGVPACVGLTGDLALALRMMRERGTAALLDAASVAVEATAPRELVAAGDSIPVTVALYNQGKTPVVLVAAQLAGQQAEGPQEPKTVQPDSAGRLTLMYHAPLALTMPWWLRSPRVGDTFTQPVLPMIAGEDRLQDNGAQVAVRIGGVDVGVLVAPIMYRFADRASGEVRRPLATVPEVSVLLQREVEYARANAPFDRTIVVSVRSGATADRDVSVSLMLPAGLKADTAIRRVTLKPFGEAAVNFRVTGRLPAGRQSISAVATTNGQHFALGYVPVEYPHIRPQRLYRAATVQIEAVAVTYADLKIGYVRGVGDNVPPMLEELGLSVTELDPATLARTKLSGFTTIVIGSRAYESPSGAQLLAATPALMQFAREGGTVITQYGQAMSLPGILPYPVTRQVDRVTDETAQVRVLDPGSPLLSSPNKIVDADFAGWVQERASYMPHGFDAKYRTVFSMNDKNEAPNDAAILVAPVGKGTYIYTTMSFFRQLPAGNPGAARLFINLLSAKQNAANRPPVTSSPVKP